MRRRLSAWLLRLAVWLRPDPAENYWDLMRELRRHVREVYGP